MDNAKLLTMCNAHGTRAWRKFGTLYTRIGEQPRIVLNNRLRTTLGRAWIEDGFIDLSTKLLKIHFDAMMHETIPHEMAHFVAWRLYGDGGHGKAWKSVMRKFGLEPRRIFELE